MLELILIDKGDCGFGMSVGKGDIASNVANGLCLAIILFIYGEKAPSPIKPHMTLLNVFQKLFFCLSLY